MNIGAGRTYPRRHTPGKRHGVSHTRGGYIREETGRRIATYERSPSSENAHRVFRVGPRGAHGNEVARAVARKKREAVQRNAARRRKAATRRRKR